MLNLLTALNSLPLATAGEENAIVASSPVAPAIILILCVLAGLGTWLLLPSKREITVRRIGGVLLLLSSLVFAALLVRWTASMGGMGVYFWVFAAIALIASVRVITHTKPVYSALYFVLTVFATAGLFVLMWAEFIAGALVLIYAGAILITYVFVIMLASEASRGAVGSDADDIPSETDGISRDALPACIVGFLLMGLLLLAILDKSQGFPKSAMISFDTTSSSFETTAKTPENNVKFADSVALDFSGSAQGLGRELVDHHAVNLQLAGLILTLAMVGAITLARRRVIVSEADQQRSIETLVVPGTPTGDDPHSIPVHGTLNPRQKSYPEN